jgi:hypothetical protein
MEVGQIIRGNDNEPSGRNDFWNCPKNQRRINSDHYDGPSNQIKKPETEDSSMGTLESECMTALYVKYAGRNTAPIIIVAHRMAVISAKTNLSPQQQKRFPSISS